MGPDETDMDGSRRTGPDETGRGRTHLLARCLPVPGFEPALGAATPGTGSDVGGLIGLPRPSALAPSAEKIPGN